MSQIGCAPTWPIDGPPPEPPVRTLVGAARVIDDISADEVERWANGVEVYPFPAGPAVAWDAYATGSNLVEKDEGDPVDLPKFGPLTVYLAETCTSRGIFGAGITKDDAQARFVGRAEAALRAVESAALEKELMGGDALGNNPHLADGNATLLNSGTVTSVVNGFALLENAIGRTGKHGWIHCSPAAVIAAGQQFIFRDDRGPAGAPVLRTLNGTIVVPGYGYIDESTPADLTELDPDDTTEYMYATGPVEIRRSQPILLPRLLSQALDREHNSITYRIERYAVIDWDVQIQVGVLVDRCQVSC